MASETRSFRSKSLKCLKPITDMKSAAMLTLRVPTCVYVKEVSPRFIRIKLEPHMSARLINMIQGSAGWCEG
jgi:hypothetical protein